MDKVIPIFTDADTVRQRIHERVIDGIKQSFPFTNSRYTVDIAGVHIKPQAYTPELHKKTIMTAKTLSEPVYGTVVLKDRKRNKVLQRTKMNLLQLPFYTPLHTFVIDGTSYTISNQLRMKPGIYVHKKRTGDLVAAFNLGVGRNFNVAIDPSKGRINLEYSNAKIPLYPVLRKLGVKNDDIAAHWGRRLTEANARAYGKNVDRYFMKLHDAITPKALRADATRDPVDNVKQALRITSLDPQVTAATVGARYDKVTPEALMAASSKLIKVFKSGKTVHDERDNMAFKRIYGVEDFLNERIKLEARTLKNKVLYKLDRSPRKDIKSVMTNSPFTASVKRFLSTSALSGNPAQINHFEINDQVSRVTSLGEGGISSERAIPVQARQQHLSQLGFIDPIRTPESKRTGIDVRATIGALKSRDGELYTALYDVKRKALRPVSIATAVHKTVAFPTDAFNDIKAGKFNKNQLVDVARNNRVESVPFKEVDYVIPDSTYMYSTATNLVPLLENIDGNRATMGAKMATQALPLEDGEPPLIQVGTNFSNKSMEEIMGTMMAPTSPTDGKIVKIKDGYIHIRPSRTKRGEAETKLAATEEYKVPFYTNFPLNTKTYFNDKLMVNVGDNVRKNQVLADSDSIKNGRAALGKNLLTAYVPYHGKNTNDAVVISESAARKLTSKHMFKFGLERREDVLIDKAKHKAHFGVQYTAEAYSKLTADGVIKKGATVNKGDILIAAVRRSAVSATGELLGRLHRSLVRPFDDAAITWDKDTPGVIVDIYNTGKLVRLTVKTKVPMNIGDKIAGRYGNKAVVSDIIPDDQMLRDAQGHVVDVAVSPLTVVSRINPAQILETAAAKVAVKLGKPIKLNNYSGKDNWRLVKSMMTKHRVKDKETLYDPITGSHLKDVFVGPQFTYKLFKSTDTNYAGRGTGGYDINLQPMTGGVAGAKSMGRLVVNALLAHNARNLLNETANIRSQKNDTWWHGYQLSMPSPHTKTSFAYDKFKAMLEGAGVKLNKERNIIAAVPLLDKDVARMSAGPIANAKMVKAKNLRPELGGLFDPNLTGGNAGTKWSHIELAEPTVNPVFEKPVRHLLGITGTQFNDLVSREGGTGIKKRLAQIDIVQEKRKLKREFLKLKGPARNSAIRKLKYLDALERSAIRPEDAYTTQKIPVIPPVFRPIIPGNRGDLQIADANWLYRDTLLANNALKESSVLPEKDQHKARLAVYNSVAALYGVKETENVQLKNRGVRGFIARIAGTGVSPKRGFFQSKLVKRRTDLSGRGTIAPDPTLDIDEIGLPEDMAWRIYNPILMRNLARRGYGAIDAKKHIDDRTTIARSALLAEMKNRPVLFNRAPTLHRYNVLAAYPKPIPGKTIRVHEMHAPLQSGDFDGDAIQIHVPIQDKAVEEAHNMLPSRMLLTDQQKFKLNKLAPQQEAVLGVYMATHAKPKGNVKKFKTRAEAMAAFNRGEIELGTPVKIGVQH